MFQWAANALNAFSARSPEQAAAEAPPAAAGGGRKPAGRKRGRDDDEPADAPKRQSVANEADGAGAAPMGTAARVKPPAKKQVAPERLAVPKVLRTVQDFEKWLREVSECPDACNGNVRYLLETTRNILMLLRESRNSEKPSTFAHAGGNPLLPGLSFEDILLQDKLNFVGRIVVNLYSCEQCKQLGKQMLLACAGLDSEQQQGLHEALSSLNIAEMKEREPRSIEILAGTIHGLQQQANLERKQKQLGTLKESVTEARPDMDVGSKPADLAAVIDALMEQLQVEREQLLPLHETISTSFQFDAAHFDRMQESVHQLEATLSEERAGLHAAWETNKAELRQSREARRSAYLEADSAQELLLDSGGVPADSSEAMKSDDDAGAFLNRMKSSEEGRLGDLGKHDATINAVISEMEANKAKMLEVDAKVQTLEQLAAFVSTAKVSFVTCCERQAESSTDEHAELLHQYSQDVSNLSAATEEHFVFQCKRVFHFTERRGPKQKELEHLNSLCLDESEGSVNRKNLEDEVGECDRLIESAVGRIDTCLETIHGHIVEFMRRNRVDPDGVASEGPNPPAEVLGDDESTAGWFEGKSAGNGEPLRIRVDGNGMAVYTGEALSAFYNYQSFRKWTTGESFFAIDPNEKAGEFGQSTGEYRFETVQAAQISHMLKRNATRLAEKRAGPESSIVTSDSKAFKKAVVMVAGHTRLADLASLIKDYATGKVSYTGDTEAGAPHGNGRLTFADGQFAPCDGADGSQTRLVGYQGAFSNGRPMGRGRYTVELSNGSTRVVDGAFIGRYPAGDGHIYKLTGKDAGGTMTEVYEGQLAASFLPHGVGKLRCNASSAAQPKKAHTVHVEGTFVCGQPAGSAVRLWMLKARAPTAPASTSLSNLPCFVGNVSAGVPEPVGELWLPASARAEKPVATIYMGAFDRAGYLDYGKPAGHGSILFPNGNIYKGPVMEAAMPEGAFMPVPMAGKLIIRGQGTEGVECVYHGEFDVCGVPQGEGRLIRAADEAVVHEGRFKDGKPEVAGMMGALWGGIFG